MRTRRRYKGTKQTAFELVPLVISTCVDCSTELYEITNELGRFKAVFGHENAPSADE